MATMRMKARIQYLRERINWLKEDGWYSEMIHLITADGHDITEAERFFVTFIKKYPFGIYGNMNSQSS